MRQRSYRSIGLGSLVVALAGCATFHSKPIIPERTAEAFGSRRLTDPGLQRFLSEMQVLTMWDLDSLTLAALYFHPDLDVARAQWKAAKASGVTARERPNPSLSVGPGTWVSNAAPDVRPWVWGFGLDIPMETAGKRGIRQRQAAAQAETARQNLAHVAWQIRSRVRATLLATITAEQAETILRHQGRELDTNARIMSQRSTTGRVSPLNAAQAIVLAGRNRLSLEDVLRLETDFRSQLADAIGVSLAALDEIALSSGTFTVLPNPNDAILSKARRAALLGRPDLLAALATYAASEAALQLEIAKQYPDIHLGPAFSFDQGQDKWSLGISFPIPVFNRNKGPIAEAEARREEAGARFLALQDKIINEVDRTVNVYRASFRKFAVATDVLEKQTKQNRTLENILRPGDVSRLTLSRSQLDIDSTALARVDAFRQAQDALGALEDALEQSLTGALKLPPTSIENNPRGN
jgi:outer membrane protein TolC